MTNTADDDWWEPGRGGERSEVEAEKVWLEDMLQRRQDPDAELGETSPGWILAGEQDMTVLMPRARAYLEGGGTLSNRELTELRRFLGVIHIVVEANREHGISAEDRAAHQAEADNIRGFDKTLRRLLGRDD